jgi:hypothetical protein
MTQRMLEMLNARGRLAQLRVHLLAQLRLALKLRLRTLRNIVVREIKVTRGISLQLDTLDRPTGWHRFILLT